IDSATSTPYTYRQKLGREQLIRSQPAFRPSLQEASLNYRLRFSFYVVLIALLSGFSPAQNQSSVVLDTSESLFAVLTSINTCGYDQELNVSDPLRSQVRSEVALARQNSQ